MENWERNGKSYLRKCLKLEDGEKCKWNEKIRNKKKIGKFMEWKKWKLKELKCKKKGIWGGKFFKNKKKIPKKKFKKKWKKNILKIYFWKKNFENYFQFFFKKKFNFSNFSHFKLNS